MGWSILIGWTIPLSGLCSSDHPRHITTTLREYTGTGETAIFRDVTNLVQESVSMKSHRSPSKVSKQFMLLASTQYVTLSTSGGTRPRNTLVTLGRLTDVSLNKNGGSREAVKNKGSVWVEGERIRSLFLTRRKITQKPNLSRNKCSLHLIFFEIFEIQNPAN